MYQRLGSVEFPEFERVNVNMMPIIMGAAKSVPQYLHRFLHMINKCRFEHGTTVYLTAHADWVERGQTLRRPGIHTEAFANHGWGGRKGIYMASTDGMCRLWDSQVEPTDGMGAIENPPGEPVLLDPSTLYWMTDKTPHEAMSSMVGGYRQFFRLVSSDVDAWFSKHNTRNPLGIKPDTKVVDYDKFA